MRRLNNGGNKIITPLRLLLSILITGLLLYFLLKNVEPVTIKNVVLKSNLVVVFLAFLTYGSVYLLRAYRFKQFKFLSSLSLRELFPVMGVHGLLNMVLPMRSGELVFIYLMRKYHKLEIGHGAGILLLARIFDFFAMATWFLIALFYYIFLKRIGFSFITLAVVIVILAALIWSVRYLGKILIAFTNWFEKLSGRYYWRSAGWTAKVIRTLEQISQTLDLVNQTSLSSRLYLTSLFVWICLFANFGLLLYAMGYESLSVAEVVIGSSGGALTSVLPINAIGNWGTLQIGWTASFSLLGMPIEEGITTGIAVHLWTTLFAFLLAFFSYITAFSPLRRKNRGP